MLRRKDKIENKFKWILVSVFAATLVLNWLAGSTTELGGVNTAQVSDSYPNLFAPAGATFAIWGIIYLLIAGFCLYLFGFGKPKKSAIKNKELSKITKLLIVNLAINSLWILAWQHKIMWLSMLLILALLISLIKISQILKGKQLRPKEYILAKLPFSIYFGWVTIATVANITIWLVSIGWSGWGISEESWTIFVLIFAALIGLITSIKNRDTAYILVFIWAYCGILIKHMSVDGFDNLYPEIIATLTICIAVFSSLAVNQVSQTKK